MNEGHEHLMGGVEPDPMFALLRCDRCRAWERVQVHISVCVNGCGFYWPAPRTMTGNWVMRWAQSHQEPTLRGVAWVGQ